MKIMDLPKFMMMLGEPLGWDEATYKDNLSLQDDSLEELNIQTYNSFQDYLFWDVLEAVTKVYMVKMDMNLEKGSNKSVSYDQVNSDNSLIEQDVANVEGGSPTKFTRKKGSLTTEQRMELRIELEFENIDASMKDVLDVEEIKRKEFRVKKAYL